MRSNGTGGRVVLSVVDPGDGVRQHFPIRRALRRQSTPRVIDQYQPHHMRRKRIKMFAIFPGRLPLPEQTQIELMHQHCSICPCVRPLPPQVAMRDGPSPVGVAAS